MKRWMLVLAVLCAAASFPLVGCSDDDDSDVQDVRDDGREVRDDAPGADGDGDDVDAADGDSDADAADADADAEAETTDPCGATSCPNDPVDGPVGLPCLDASECESGFECFAETVEVFNGEEYVNDPDGYCLPYGAGAAGCDPDVSDSCPDGSQCQYLGTTTTGIEYYGCYDSCSVASSAGVPWENNCDCRDGYMCEIRDEYCVGGCSHDRECCEIWDDANSNFNRDTGEVTVLPASECTDTCDPCTYACTQEGCPGGECDMTSTCEHDSDCPAHSWCLPERRLEEIIGGFCILERCDLSGRECPLGSGCGNVGSTADPLWWCLQSCTAGTEPGDAGYPCRDAGVAGTPDAGDHACNPVDSTFWFDGTAADGFCYPGNFPGGDGTLGTTCTEDADCLSPLGLGGCPEYFEGIPKMCMGPCSATMAADGYCDELMGPGAARGSGVCLDEWSCLPSCTTPGGAPGSNGCPGSLACYDVAPFGAAAFTYATGATAPVGFCWWPCTSNADCAAMWTTMVTCDVATATCHE